MTNRPITVLLSYDPLNYYHFDDQTDMVECLWLLSRITFICVTSNDQKKKKINFFMLKRLFQLTVKPVTSKSHRQLMDADYPGLRYAREKISHSAVTYGETPCLTSPGTSECRMNGQGH